MKKDQSFPLIYEFRLWPTPALFILAHVARGFQGTLERIEITVTDFTMICLVNWIELDVNDLNVCVLHYLLMKCTIKFTFWIANTWRNIKTTAYREIFVPPPCLRVNLILTSGWIFLFNVFFNNWRKFTMK